MIPIIGLASGVGGSVPGSRYAPHAVKEYLQNLPLKWRGILEEHASISSDISIVEDLNTRLANEILQLLRTQQFFLMCGGDHSCAIGTWSGVAEAYRVEGDIGLIWIDAHMDAHTFETSETGNIHGMPLAALLGRGDVRLAHILTRYPKIKPENLVLIGTRSFEEGEAQLLRELNVKIFSVDSVREEGFLNILEKAVVDVSKNTIGYGISFDLDVIDPKEINAVGTPVPDGLSIKEVLSGLESSVDFSKLLAFEIVEYNPELDNDLITMRIIEKIFGIIIENLKEHQIANLATV